MRKTNATVAAHLANAAYPILNMTQGIVPERLKQMQAVRQQKEQLNAQMNVAKAKRNEPVAEHKRSDSFGFVSPADHPELYEDKDDALPDKGASQAKTAMPTPVSQLEQLGTLVAENGMANALIKMSHAQIEAFVDYMDEKIELESLEQPQHNKSQ